MPQIQIKQNYFKALIIFTVIALWIVTGYFFPGAESEDGKADNENLGNKNLEVRIEEFQAELRKKKVSIKGVTDASKKIDVKAEIGGKVEEILVDEGSFVNKGEIILRIEKRDKQQRVEEFEALVEEKEIDYESARKLQEKGLQSKSNVAAALSKLQKAKADLMLAEINLDNTEVKAPFSGFIEKINVEVGDFVQSGFGGAAGGDQGFGGESITTIIDVNPFIVKAGASERVAPMIKTGMNAEIDIISMDKIIGVVTYKSRVANEATRTFSVEVTAEGDVPEVASGLTASLMIPVKEELAHKLPSSALFLNDKGEFGIKTLQEIESVSENAILGEVKFHKVDIYDSEIDGVWISGLPEKINLITLGGAYVEQGQEVVGKYPEKLD